VLAHGGVTELLKYADLVRFAPQLLLDLSFTIMKYAGSSLDLDLAYVIKNLDQRVCVGTDFPEFDHAALRKRFEALTRGLPAAKIRNAASENIRSFLGIK
jgi:hypothetical protein